MTQHISNLGFARPVVLWRSLAACVTGVRVLDFPKIETDRKPQNSFQTNFIKLMAQAQRKGRSSELTWGLALLGCFYKLGTKWAYVKGDLSAVVAFLKR